MNPKGSICTSGLGVSLHCKRGVGSPNLFAHQACAYSWILIATTSTIAIKRVCIEKISDSMASIYIYEIMRWI